MKNDSKGGDAFPRAVSADNEGGLNHGLPGMSMRDWFAGQALPAVIEMCDLYFRGNHDADAPKLDEYARDAYRIADAMLAERAKE